MHLVDALGDLVDQTLVAGTQLGDLLVTIEIEVPSDVNDEERAALDALAAARTRPSPRARLEV